MEGQIGFKRNIKSSRSLNAFGHIWYYSLGSSNSVLKADELWIGIHVGNSDLTVFVS